MTESKKANTTKPQTSQPQPSPKPKNPYLANGKFNCSNTIRLKDSAYILDGVGTDKKRR